MDYVALIIFLALYYLRPQEWFSAFNALRPVQVLSLVAIVGLARANKLKPRDLVRTPLDWLILAYFLWTLFAGDQFMQTLGGIEAVLLFYFVAVRSLDTVPRQKTFLMWWCLFILIISVLALATQYGFDPLNSNDKTNGIMKGRLVLNLSIFNNPNSLAHSVVPVLPLVYYLFFWRRTFLKVGIVLLAIPLYCIYLTQSKGAFLCCFCTLLATLIFGRSLVWQCTILGCAVLFGYGALYALPRMNELQHSKADPAIQGRVAALSYGLQLMRTHPMGIGLGNFPESFLRYGPMEKVETFRSIPGRHVTGANGVSHELDGERRRVFKWQHFFKATHGAYNQNGAELGYVGLFLFVGILYCCIRTLLLVKSQDNDEERIRRALFATVVAYAVSSWMVDFTYRPTFFMFVAAISAFHRHLLDKDKAPAEPAPEAPVVASRPWLRRLQPASLPPIPGFISPMPAGAVASLPMPAQSAPAQPACAAGQAANGRTLAWHKDKPSLADTIARKFIWTRLGIMDYLIMLALTYGAIQYWKHLIATM